MPLPSVREIDIKEFAFCKGGGFSFTYTFSEKPISKEKVILDTLCPETFQKEMMQFRYRKPHLLLLKLPTFVAPMNFFRDMFTCKETQSDEELVQHLKRLLSIELEDYEQPRMAFETFEQYADSLPDLTYFVKEKVEVMIEGQREKGIVIEKCAKDVYIVRIERTNEDEFVRFTSMRSIFKPKNGETCLEIWC